MLNTTDIFTDLKPMNQWWLNDPNKLMAYIYWQHDYVAPLDKKLKTKEWDNLVKQLNKRHPVPIGIEIPTL